MSGPLRPEDDRFANGTTDIGFICPPSYLWLTDGPTPSVELVPLAPVHDDARNGGRPAYVSDVVVRADADIGSFADLADRRVGYNERASLSGFVSLLSRLDLDGHDVGFFGELRQVGSHQRALALIESGDIDAAAVDANVLRAWAATRSDGGGVVRSVDVLGPFPVQPVVVRSGGEPGLAAAVAEQLLRPRARLRCRSLRRHRVRSGEPRRLCRSGSARRTRQRAASAGVGTGLTRRIGRRPSRRSTPDGVFEELERGFLGGPDVGFDRLVVAVSELARIVVATR